MLNKNVNNIGKAQILGDSTIAMNIRCKSSHVWESSWLGLGLFRRAARGISTGRGLSDVPHLSSSSARPAEGSSSPSAHCGAHDWSGSNRISCRSPYVLRYCCRLPAGDPNICLMHHVLVGWRHSSSAQCRDCGRGRAFFCIELKPSFFWTIYRHSHVCKRAVASCSDWAADYILVCAFGILRVRLLSTTLEYLSLQMSPSKPWLPREIVIPSFQALHYQVLEPLLVNDRSPRLNQRSQCTISWYL